MFCRMCFLQLRVFHSNKIIPNLYSLNPKLRISTQAMLINEQTKIAALLKHHPDALETIITISPDFKKLRNPILRKLMAGRTSIAMASKIGGCQPEDFFKALAPLGFETDANRMVVTEDEIERKPVS